MVDLAVTAANVVRGVGAKVKSGIAGAVITAGQSVYKDLADSDKFKLADADSTTAAVRTTRGIALNGAANNQPLAVQVERPLIEPDRLVGNLVNAWDQLAVVAMPARSAHPAGFDHVVEHAPDALLLRVALADDPGAFRGGAGSPGVCPAASPLESVMTEEQIKAELDEIVEAAMNTVAEDTAEIEIWITVDDDGD